MTVQLRELACGFHSHAHHSLDGGSTCKHKVKYAAKLGRPADCLTDHGIMSGLAEHWMAAEDVRKDKKSPHQIISIHGIEAYIIDPDRPPKMTKKGVAKPEYYHLTIHFKTVEAYEYFCKLTPIMESRAVVKGGEPKPLMTFSELEPIAGQITMGSGCMMGPVQKNLLQGRSDLARHYYDYLRGLAGKDNFWVEVFPHRVSHDWKRAVYDENWNVIEAGTFVPAKQRRDEAAIDAPFEPDPCSGVLDLQKPLNEFVLEQAARYGDPVIISLDDHFSEVEDKLVQDVRLGNGQERWKFYGTYASYKASECAKMLQEQLGVPIKRIEEWIDNSYRFVEQFKNYKFHTAKERLLLPTTELVYGPEIKIKTNRQVLAELIVKHGRMPAPDDPRHQVFKDRLEYEIGVLADNGIADFLPYFFVLEDAVDYAKKNEILWNTRGSAGGSLVTYLLGISITDPIKYDLPFERFMTLGRIMSGSLPDIDTDWEDKDVIIGYLRSKYGDLCSMIATDLNLRLKSSILDVERALHGNVSDTTKRMCKAIPATPQGIPDRDWLYGYVDKTTQEPVQGYWDQEESKELREWSKAHPNEWLIVEKCIGVIKTRGVHAGGIVISPTPIHHHMPIIMTKKGGSAVAYNMKGAEYIGAVKYDFLGLTAMKALSVTLRALRSDGIVDLKWEEFPYDKAVFDNIIAKNLLASIFQLNTKIVAPFAAKIPPKSIKEMSNMTALCRPGALDADAPNPDFKIGSKKGTAADYYVACVAGEAAPYLIHPDLGPILSDTQGIVIFQEQLLKVFRDLGGYTYETAEDVRRAVGKKIKELMDKHMGVLVVKLVDRGWTKEQAEQLCDTLVKSARYSFNESHSTSYAIVGYNQCYLKYHYPLYYWKGVLTAEPETEKIRSYMVECKQYLLKIDALKSHPTEWSIEKDGLRPPLSLLKGVGEQSAQVIYKVARELEATV